MINILKFEHSSMSKLFLTSDTHFYHSKLIELRGFKNIDDHNETLIRNWNAVVRPSDTVIHLGDFVLGAGDKSKEVCEQLFQRLNGHIILLWGNHLAGVKKIYFDLVVDKLGYSSINPSIEIYPLKWKNKVTFVGYNVLAKVKNKIINKTHFIFCSHFAHRIWIDGNKGVLHACGHSHSSDMESNPDFKFSKRLDVGVDNFNFTPLLLDKFLEIMDTKQHSIIDHHSNDTNPSF